MLGHPNLLLRRHFEAFARELLLMSTIRSSTSTNMMYICI